MLVWRAKDIRFVDCVLTFYEFNLNAFCCCHCEFVYGVYVEYVSGIETYGIFSVQNFIVFIYTIDLTF